MKPGDNVVTRFIRGWETLDPEMILGTIAEDAKLIWGTDADETWHSKEAFAAAVHVQVSSFQDPIYKWADGDPVEIEMSDGVVVAGELNVSVSVAGETHQVAMRTTFVVQGNLEEGWIVHGHFSTADTDQAVPYSR